jgi:hypothetical protein
MEAFLPVPDRRLEGEVTLGSLAFPREQYHAVRDLLIALDATDETHGVLEELKALVKAPVKTLILLRRGRESTYAKKEAPAFGFLNASSYAALHWNPGEENAREQLYAALRGTARWMRGDRSATYPSPPTRSAAKPRMLAGKSDAPDLDFTREVLKRGARKGPTVP